MILIKRTIKQIHLCQIALLSGLYLSMLDKELGVKELGRDSSR